MRSITLPTSLCRAFTPSSHCHFLLARLEDCVNLCYIYLKRALEILGKPGNAGSVLAEMIAKSRKKNPQSERRARPGQLPVGFRSELRFFLLSLNSAIRQNLKFSPR